MSWHPNPPDREPTRERMTEASPPSPLTGSGRLLLRSGQPATDGTHSGLDYHRFRETILAIEAEARAAERTEHQPGDHHRYRIECEVCGQRGTIRLSVDPDLADLVVDGAVRPEEPPE